MILVDSSVWIDFFRHQPSPQAEWLDKKLGIESLTTVDHPVPMRPYPAG